MALHLATSSLLLATWHAHPLEAEERFVGTAATQVLRGELDQPAALSQEPYTLGSAVEVGMLAAVMPVLGDRVWVQRLLAVGTDLGVKVITVASLARLASPPLAFLTGLAWEIAPEPVLRYRGFFGIPHARAWGFLAPLLLLLHRLRSREPGTRGRLVLAGGAGVVAGLGVSAYLLFAVVVMALLLGGVLGVWGPLSRREKLALAAGFLLGVVPVLGVLGMAERGPGSNDPARLLSLLRQHVWTPFRAVIFLSFPVASLPLLWDNGWGSTASRALLAQPPAWGVLGLAVAAGREAWRTPRSQRRALPLERALPVLLLTSFALLGLGAGAPPFTLLPAASVKYQLVLYPACALLAASATLSFSKGWRPLVFPSLLLWGGAGLGVTAAQGWTDGDLMAPAASPVWRARQDARLRVPPQRVGTLLEEWPTGEAWIYAFGAGAVAQMSPQGCVPPPWPVDPGGMAAYGAGCCFGASLGASGMGFRPLPEDLPPPSASLLSALEIPESLRSSVCRVGGVEFLRFVQPDGAPSLLPRWEAKEPGWNAAFALQPSADIFSREGSAAEIRARGLPLPGEGDENSATPPSPKP